MKVFEQSTLITHTPCLPADIGSVCRSIAIVHAELLLLHPFRDGNGRLAQWPADLMAFQAALPPPLYGFVGRGAGRQRKRYVVAVQKGCAMNYEDLTDFFREAIERRREAP